jgi:hypothetical protein
MKYKVLEANNIAELEQMVEQYMTDGFTPTGGVSILQSTWERGGDSGGNTIYHQAMVKTGE